MAWAAEIVAREGGLKIKVEGEMKQNKLKNSPQRGGGEGGGKSSLRIIIKNEIEIYQILLDFFFANGTRL